MIMVRTTVSAPDGTVIYDATVPIVVPVVRMTDISSASVIELIDELKSRYGLVDGAD